MPLQEKRMVKIAEILRYIEELGVTYDYMGCDTVEIETFCPLRNLKDKAITWVRHFADISVPQFCGRENVVLLADFAEKQESTGINIVWVDNPHRTYFKVLEKFFGERNPDKKECMIEKSSVVESRNIGKNVYIGHQCYIGADVVIGDHVTILHHVTIQGKVEIGSDTVIESGTVIGACGFGFYEDFDGNQECVPHLGGVKIGSHVKIGANNSISRGCLDDTVLEDYVKTDNLCHIAHNDYIKRGAMLTAGVLIAGSTTVGENVWLAPGSVLNNAITVGKDSYFGLGAVATKDVPENKVMVGVPAKALRDHK